VHEFEIRGDVSESAAEEEGQESEEGYVSRTLGCGGHVPGPLQRLALQAELLPPPLDDPPAHRWLRLSQEEGARAELVMEGSLGLGGRRREPGLERCDPGGGDLVRCAPRIRLRRIRRRAREALARQTRELPVNVP